MPRHGIRPKAKPDVNARLYFAPVEVGRSVEMSDPQLGSEAE